MARPTRRKGTLNGQFRKAIPPDIQRILAKLPAAYRPRGWGKAEITITLGTADSRKAAIEHARIQSEVLERFEVLEAFAKNGPRPVSQKEATALAGEVYSALAIGGEDDPGPAAVWRRAVAANEAAGQGRYGAASLKIGPPQEVRKWSMEERFGAMADAVLATKCLIVDLDSRTKLIEALAKALDDASRKLERNAEGDYSPDTKVAERFPKWEKAGSARASITALFEGWKAEGGRGDESNSVKRWRPIVRDLIEFVKHDDATRLTADDIIRWKDSLIAGGRDPRSVMRTNLAAIKTILAWGVDNRRVEFNAATGVKVKAPIKQQMREKDFTQPEVEAILRGTLDVRRGRQAEKNVLAKRWCPWLCAYSGSRITEMTQLRKEDFERIGGIWAMHVTPEAGGVKTGRPKVVPLHPHLIEQGILDFVASAAAGPLFYEPDPTKPGGVSKRRAESVSGKISQWVRKECGVTDPHIRPNHAWRHLFKTLCDMAGIEEKFSDALTGHVPKTVARQYGSGTRLVPVLYREICKLPRFEV